MNPTQKQFSLNRGAPRKQIPISSVNPFLIRADTGASLVARLGIAGYYGDHSLSCVWGCPGQVIFGPQPNTPTGFHTATGSYWWCVSFAGMINALTYVDDLAITPGTYAVTSNNCTTQAEAVGAAAGAPVGFSGFTPWNLSDYLTNLPPATCSGCQ